MGRPRQFDDAQLLEAARQCFFEHGAGVSTQVIAQRAGVSQAVLFQRFGTKEQLMLAALAPDEPRWTALAARGPDERPIPEQLTALGRQIYEHFCQMLPRLAVLRSSGLPPERVCGEGAGSAAMRARVVMVGWFARAQRAGRIAPHDPESLADLFLGALHIRPLQQHLSASEARPSDQNGSRYVAAVVEALWRGMQADVGQSHGK